MNPTAKHIPYIGVCFLISAVWYVFPHPLIILVIAVAPIGAYIVGKFTFWIALLFILFSFFRIHEVIPALYSLKIPLLLSLCAISSLFWNIFITQDIQIYWSKELTVISIFFCLVALGLMAASNRPIAIEYFKNIYIKIIIMTFAISWMIKRKREFSATSLLVIVSGCLVGAVAITNKLDGIGLVEETRVTIGRALGSVLGDPNDLALVLMFPTAFSLALALTPGLSTIRRVVGYVSIPLLFFAIIATQSRGGLLGFVAILSVYGYRHIKSKVLLVSVGFVFACFLFVFAGISDRKSGGASEAGIDASAQGRLYAWEAATKMALDNPLTGVGIDNFYSNYYFYSPHWDGLNHAVHSTWFGILAETGVLGFGVFVILVSMLLKRAYQSVQYIERYYAAREVHDSAAMKSFSLAVFSGLIGTIVSGTFLTHGFTWPIYILSGLVVALSQWCASHPNNQIAK
ncbi:MAG: O-antigen ligase family protein [Agarilytica sp.]